jgi:hypothetical protein
LVASGRRVQARKPDFHLLEPFAGNLRFPHVRRGFDLACDLLTSASRIDVAAALVSAPCSSHFGRVNEWFPTS